MHEYEKELTGVKMRLLEELASYHQAKDITPDIAAQIKTLASAADHLCNVCEALKKDGGGSSGRMSSGYGWHDGGSYRGGSSYDGGDSSGRRGRDAMGRYTSRDGGFREKLEEAMRMAPGDAERRDLEDMLARAH